MPFAFIPATDAFGIAMASRRFLSATAVDSFLGKVLNPSAGQIQFA
jgi:hypothetical protein